MRSLRLIVLGAALASSVTNLLAGPVNFSVGVRLGGPVYSPYYYRPYPYYYAPAPIYVSPAPVVYQSAPIVVEQPRTVVVPASSSSTYEPSYGTTTTSSWSPETVTVNSATIAGKLQLLNNPDENVRCDAVMDIGRAKAESAIDSLAATLAGDRSARVREAAARALGLIGSPRSLTALTHAAQADSDHEVRHSAQFAVEVIRANTRQN